MLPLGWVLRVVVQPTSGDTGSCSVRPVLLLLLSHVLISSRVGRIWRGFGLRVLSFAMQQHKLRANGLITLGSHLWQVVGLHCCTCTGSSGCTAGSILEVFSCCDFCCSGLV